MSKFPSRSGAPSGGGKSGKKARWTPQQKAIAKRAKREAIGGDGRRRDASLAERARWDVRRFEETPGRDGRPGRQGDREGGRPARRFERDDRGPRRFEREERGPRRFASDGERPARSFGRDERPVRRFDRDDRRPAGSGERPPRRWESDGERPARSFDRDDRGSRGFDRDTRPARSFDRDDRPARRFDRGGRPVRSFDRDDRGSRRFERDGERPGRRFDREERGPRRYGDEERPARSFDRDDRPARRFDRDDRPTRPARAPHPTPHARPERLARRAAPTPVEVTEDNAFAALGLPEELVARLARDGIAEPFPIQAATIPDVLAGRDVLGRARTGSGKTLAFGLPTVARLTGGHANPQHPRCVILVPTRELAMQVADALQPFAHVAGLRHKLVAGGMPYQPQLDALERGLDILVATPGRLRDLMQRGAAQLDEVEIAVIDEADHMAEMGFLEEITEILDAAPGGQRLLFSATLDHGIDKVVEKYLTEPVTHETDEGGAAVATMTHHAWIIPPDEKKRFTAHLASRPGRTIVFTRTKLGCERVARELREAGVFAAALHGDMAQNARSRVITAFRDGEIPVLVATDVAARGIHVDDVGMVVQVDPPADHKDYLHRSGRTARAGEEGAVVSLVLPHQKRTVERLLGEAGVGEPMVSLRLGDPRVAEVGAREPSGEPIPEAELQRLIAPPRRTYYGGPRQGGGRQGGGRQGGRPAQRRYGRATDR